MIELDVKADGIANLQRLMLVESAATKRALVAAMRGEAFQLRTGMKGNIQRGTPAPGHSFATRSMMSRLMSKSRLGMKGAWPLTMLAAGVTYHVQAGKNYQISVGFTKERSPYWVRMAAYYQQKGFTRTITDSMRREFARYGGRRRGSRSHRQKGLARFMFLRKGTTVLRTPARPIVEPFWAWARQGTIDRIRQNFRIKLAGGRFMGGGNPALSTSWGEYVRPEY